MKVKITPLLLVACALVLYTIYYVVTGQGGNLVGLAVIFFCALALLCLGISYLLRKMFRGKMSRLILAELLVIAAGVFIFYQRSGHMMLQVPKGFQGYIYVVYEVKGAPELKKDIFSADFEVEVPSSGIIITSSSRSKSVGVFDSATGKASSGTAGPGYPIKWDTIHCLSKSFPADVLAFKNYREGWSFKSDTIRQKAQRELACNLVLETTN